MAAVLIGLCLFLGACIGIIGLILFLIWFMDRQLWH